MARKLCGIWKRGNGKSVNIPVKDPPNKIQVDNRLQQSQNQPEPATVVDDRLSSTKIDDRSSDGEQEPSQEIINATYDMCASTQLGAIPEAEEEIPPHMIDEADKMLTIVGPKLSHIISPANMAMDERVGQLERENETLKRDLETIKQRMDALERRLSTQRPAFDMHWEPKSTFAAVKSLNEDLLDEVYQKEFSRSLMQKMAAAGQIPKNPLLRLLRIIINREHLRRYTPIQPMNGKQPLAKLGCLMVVIKQAMEAIDPGFDVDRELPKVLNSNNRPRKNNNQTLLAAKTFIESVNNGR